MKILYICTHNRCRSILCEAITNASNGKIEARSAGSQPVGEVHLFLLSTLQSAGLVQTAFKASRGMNLKITMLILLSPFVIQRRVSHALFISVNLLRCTGA